MNRPKTLLKTFLENNGWYLRKTKGLPAGIDCFHEIRYRLGGNLDVVLDIGAHHGETTLKIIERFPQARVYAFEPVTANFDVLQTTVHRLANVTCHQLAVTDCTGTAEILLQEGSQTHTLKRGRAADGSSPGRTARVPVTTLDNFLRKTPVGKIDLLKADVEGCELKVLNGARETLSNNPPRLILLEATLDPADDVHSPLMELTECLNGYGYQLLCLYDQEIWSRPLRLAYFNVLFAFHTRVKAPAEAGF